MNDIEPRQTKSYPTWVGPTQEVSPAVSVLRSNPSAFPLPPPIFEILGDMKGSSGTLVASVLAASTVALSSSTSSSGGDRHAAVFYPSCNEGFSSFSGKNNAPKEKFTPRFDGLSGYYTIQVSWGNDFEMYTIFVEMPTVY
ncbi:hypothetical protein FEM48_Zijuj11G0001700 [Ziziphus jujuba var. spinosa]|uniref:Uncharacterized protein n=1 Tax=Ziziphus jujuba var. spinosa TaxID=714518 RepID=A0A978UFQ3_ZIZJJ|nr:hypothetical protein FEM48_Zijuj11G0001700 [Ziziphus jujuba var. spinosa]